VGIEEIISRCEKLLVKSRGVWKELSATLVDPGGPFWALVMQGLSRVRDSRALAAPDGEGKANGGKRR
jgi:predicted NUDIX family NTP pyrophosphohydrolase